MLRKINNITKKVLLLSSLTLGIMGTFSTTTSASEQYHSTITLPRTGWWSTVTRRTTSDRSTTMVSQNTVSIYARITNDSTITTSTKEHRGSDSGVSASSLSHTHNVSGANLRAQFRTGNLELRTHRVRVGWRP